VTASIDLLHYILVAIVGLCCGSFATALVYRIPRDISWIYDKNSKDNKASRSQCTECGRKLTAFDLVPVFSWLFSKGKCRHCGKPVSARYPLIEIATMFLVILQFHAWGMTLAAIPVLFAVPFLLAALLIDWEHMILPDDLNIVLFILSVVFVVILGLDAGWPVMFDHAMAAILLTGVFWAVAFVLTRLKGQQALGMGDLKFLPAAGLFMGLGAIPSFMALSGVLGLATGLFKRIQGKKQAFPFGPALILSLYIHVFLTGLGFDYKW